jgi:hypothetical protein
MPEKLCPDPKEALAWCQLLRTFAAAADDIPAASNDAAIATVETFRTVMDRQDMDRQDSE